MKTIEEKAKAYDEALERAKAYHRNELAGSRKEMTEYIFPELRESEDERIRKWLVAQMQKFHDEANREGRWEDFCMTEKAIFYLEKQKEQKPVEWTELTWKDIVELEGIINNVHYDFSAGIGQESFGKEVLERFRNKKDDAEVDACEQKPAEKQDYSGLTDFERAIHRGFLCAGVVNVPVTIIKETAQDCLAHLQAEWSKEDWKLLDEVREHIIGVIGDKPDLTPNKIYDGFLDLIDNLKRLRPQPKQEWSEEDEKILHGIEQCVYDNVANIGTMNKVRYIDWLKSLRPQPHWKPSEEQIQAITYLASSIPPNFLKEQEYTMRLVDEVIEQLKKL